MDYFEQPINSPESEPLNILVPSPEGLVWDNQYENGSESVITPQWGHQQGYQNYYEHPNPNYEKIGAYSPVNGDTSQYTNAQLLSSSRIEPGEANITTSSKTSRHNPKSKRAVRAMERTLDSFPLLRKKTDANGGTSLENSDNSLKESNQQQTFEASDNTNVRRSHIMQETRDVKDKARYSSAEDLLINRCRRELDLSWQDVTEVLHTYDPDVTPVRTKGSLQVHYSQRLSKQESNFEALDFKELNDFKSIFEENVNGMVHAIKNESNLVLGNKNELNFARFLNHKLQLDKIRMERSLEQVCRVKRTKPRYYSKNKDRKM